MRATRTAAAGASAVLVLSGCGVFRDGAVHPSVNDCVAAIPVGQALVGKTARLAQLRRLNLTDTQRLLARLQAPPLVRGDARPSSHPGAGVAPDDMPTDAPTAVPTAQPSTRPSARPTDVPAGAPQPCILVFSGTFTTTSLAAAPGISGTGSGDFVVLVTTTRHPRVLRTVITGSDPLR